MNVMTDLETLGTVPGCAILSIGACGFDENGIVPDTDFYCVVSTQSCVERFLTIDRDTQDWWNRQEHTAQTVLREAQRPEALPIDVALAHFNSYLSQFTSDRYVWGNGADFDNAILQVAYSVCGIKPGWKFTNGRCYRTLKSLHPDIKLVRTGVYHNALDDARSQAEHAGRLLLRQRDCGALWGDFQDDGPSEVGEGVGALVQQEGADRLRNTVHQADTPGERVARQNVSTGIPAGFIR